MKRAVLISEAADHDIREICRWRAEHRSSEEAERWHNGLVDELLKLDQHAERFAAAAESHAFSIQVYQINFGLGSRPTHRALYLVREEQVLILRVRHLAQRDLAESELFES